MAIAASSSENGRTAQRCGDLLDLGLGQFEVMSQAKDSGQKIDDDHRRQNDDDRPIGALAVGKCVVHVDRAPSPVR